jgi:hypothetical protein
MEQRSLTGAHRDLGESTPNTRRIELVERHVGCPHRDRQGVELHVWSEVDLAGLDQQRGILRRLETAPSDERLSGQSDVARIVVGDPDGT